MKSPSFSSLLSIYSAGQKVSRLIGQKVSSNWYIFDGANFDLFFASVGLAHAMIVIGEKLAEENQVRKTVDTFTTARKLIEPLLGELPTSVPAYVEPRTIPTGIIEEGAVEMEPLFQEAKKKLKSTDVNEFWDKAADTHKPAAKPDMLSYEQAKQLGLAPEDET